MRLSYYMNILGGFAPDVVSVSWFGRRSGLPMDEWRWRIWGVDRVQAH
jgi:hypothetical protein